MADTLTTTMYEQERLQALQRYHMLDTKAEQSFQSTTELMASIFRVPMAMISLVDADEVFFDSRVGIDYNRAPRQESLCALTILSEEVNVIEDTLKHPVAATKLAVCGELGVRFYAGAPLITPNGYRIGTVCLADTKPRAFSHQDKIILEGFARNVMDQMELRLANLLETEKQVCITEQLIQSNLQLQASEEHFENILDTMAEGVAIIGLAGEITYTNATARLILGVSKTIINRRSLHDDLWHHTNIDGSPLPKDDHPISVVFRTRQPVYDFEVAISHPQKEKIYVSINAAPIIDPKSGQVTGGISTFMDVTARRKMIQQKDEFINVASHELKTPVTSLKVSMQILNRMKDNPNPDVMTKMISQADKSLDKLTRLIKDLLDSNRISQGQLHLRKTSFVIGELIAESCNHIKITGTHKVVVQGKTGLVVLADEQQIDQVLVNLINNAVKYAPESKAIYINVTQEENMARIAVQDQGSGIHPDKKRFLFDRYYRADYSSFQFSGLGLGLFICSEIIKKHGGQIGVESELEKGSTFWFTLPLN